jgi:NodT family efflux transporter outer membrane factor (OMF) lipoprotein
LALPWLLAGCGLSAVPPAVPPLQLPLPPHFSGAIPPPRPPVDLSRYWSGFNDPELDRLVDEAVAQNYTIKAAGERIVAAAAAGGSAKAALLPDLTASGATQESRLSSIGEPLEGGSTFQRTALASLYSFWTLPLFGRFTATHNGANAVLQVATAERQAAQVAVVAEVASAYIALRADQQQQMSLQTELAAARHIVDLVNIQAGAGIASELDVARAQNHVDELAFRLPAAKLAITTDILRLTALEGRFSPDPGLSTPKPLPAAPPPPAVVPADLLRLRPQIIQAEAVVATNAANLGIANANLYPQFALGGSLSLFNGASILNPLTATNLPNTLTFFEAGPGLTIPLFDWWEHYDRARAAQAGLAASIQDYHAAVVDGVIDVDTALAGITAAHEEVLIAAREQQSAMRALNWAELLFSHGLTNLSDLLNVEQEQEKADMDATAAAAAVDNATIKLYEAVGGGVLPH